MIKARASGSKVYLYFMKKGRQARHSIPRISCLFIQMTILDQKQNIDTATKNVFLQRSFFTIQSYIALQSYIAYTAQRAIVNYSAIVRTKCPVYVVIQLLSEQSTCIKCMLYI